ncbi:hypothetical protein Tco_0536433 [Tanacetum coccineum]
MKGDLLLEVVVAYEGPSIPTNPSPRKVVGAREKRGRHSDREGNTKDFEGSIPLKSQPVTMLSPFILNPDVSEEFALKPTSHSRNSIFRKSLLSQNISISSRQFPEKVEIPGTFLSSHVMFPGMDVCPRLDDLGREHKSAMPLILLRKMLLLFLILYTNSDDFELAGQSITYLNEDSSRRRFCQRVGKIFIFL